MASMYAKYIEEKTTDQILETDRGFATYRYIDHEGIKSVYIIDIYVLPECRQQGFASYMTEIIAKKSASDGCKQMFGTVMPSSKGSTLSLKAQLGNGFELSSSAQDAIILRKEI